MPNPSAVRRALLEAALAYPEATLDHPWDEDVVKVRGKIFVFFGRAQRGRLTLGVKLPESRDAALTLPTASPSGYGLGKSGWINAVFTAKDKIDMDLLLEWIDESYRAVAPKRLSGTLNTELDTEVNPARATRRAAVRAPRRRR